MLAIVGGGFLVEAIAFFVYIFFTLLVFLTGFLMLVFLSVVFLKHCFGVLLGWFFAYSTFFVGEFDPGSG